MAGKFRKMGLWLKDLMSFLYHFLKCACCHAYVLFCAICVGCSDCGLVNYVLSHAGMCSCPYKCVCVFMF